MAGQKKPPHCGGTVEIGRKIRGSNGRLGLPVSPLSPMIMIMIMIIMVLFVVFDPRHSRLGQLVGLDRRAGQGPRHRQQQGNGKCFFHIVTAQSHLPPPLSSEFGLAGQQRPGFAQRLFEF